MKLQTNEQTDKWRDKKIPQIFLAEDIKTYSDLDITNTDLQQVPEGEGQIAEVFIYWVVAW